MLNVAYSPCPNDTFLFHAFQAGLIPFPEPLSVTHLDIEQLNSQARLLKYDIMKVSSIAALHLLDDYIILPVGAALGFNCGPKLVATTPFPLSDFQTKSVITPGKNTTANALLSYLLPPAKTETHASYETIPSLLHQNQADCGVIIHETRFKLKELNLHEIVDLGTLWEEKTHLPIPLGVLIAKRSLGGQKLRQIVNAISRSLMHARSSPHLSKEYIIANAQEKEWGIIQQHIDLYVTNETANLTQTGLQAIKTLMQAANVTIPLESAILL